MPSPIQWPCISTTRAIVAWIIRRIPIEAPSEDRTVQIAIGKWACEIPVFGKSHSRCPRPRLPSRQLGRAAKEGKTEAKRRREGYAWSPTKPWVRLYGQHSFSVTFRRDEIRPC